MGRDKASLAFGGETLLQRAVRIVSCAVEDVVVVARSGQPLPDLPPHVRLAFDDAVRFAFASRPAAADTKSQATARAVAFFFACAAVAC